MTQIRNQVDRIILGLKHQDALKDVRFVREYSSKNVETPINGLLAVVSIKSTEQSKSYIGEMVSSSLKGDMYTAEVQIRVYAPADENGSGLSELVSEMLIGLKEADEQKIISKTSASSIEFDPDMNAVFRTLDFTIDFCLCEEGSV